MAERIPGRSYAEQGIALPGSARALSPDMQAWMTGLDVPDNDMGAKMTSPYMQSTWIYTAVSVMAENLAQIPFRISKVRSGDARRIRSFREATDPRDRQTCRRSLGENIVDSGDVFELFNRPHPTMDKTLFWMQIVSWDTLRGEAFIIPLDEGDGVIDLSARAPRVSRLLTLDTSLFWHMVVGFDLEGWRYTGSPLLTPLPSQMLLPSEVIHIRNVNPYNYWRGLSPLLVAMLPAMSDYAASMFMKGLLMNNADTGVIATTEQNLSQDQRNQFIAALRERKRKAGTPDRPLFLSSGVKIEKPSISNVDMQFLETRKLLRQEISAIYKVPEGLMGFSERKASSLSGGGDALNEEKLTFVEQNLTAKCHRYEAALDPVIRTFGEDLVCWFDIEGLPIMQESRRARLDSAAKIFAMGMPVNVINRVYDLGFPDVAWGNKGFLPFNLQPADSMVALPGEDNPDPAAAKPGDEKPEDGKSGPFSKLAGLLRGMGEAPATVKAAKLRKPNTKLLWEREMRRRLATVKAFQSKVCRVLNDFRAKTLAKLATVHLESMPGANSRGLIDLIFNAAEFGSALRVMLEPPMRMALQEAGAGALEDIGINDPWRMPDPKVIEYLASRSGKILGVGGTVRDRINTSLEAGVQAGETHEQLAARVREVFNSLVKAGEEAINVPESLRVARTEVNCCYNKAAHEAYWDSGVEYKYWISSHGPNPRLEHIDVEADTADAPIPIDEPFRVMTADGREEEMMYPGDDSLGATAGNIINCECFQGAAKKTAEDADSLTFNIIGIGEVRFARVTQAIKHKCAG